MIEYVYSVICYNLPMKIKLFETFAGVGSQRMAFQHKFIDAAISEDSLISEWYIDAIIAYWKIHHNGKIKYKNPSVKEMKKQFEKLGLSRDSKEPFNFTEQWVRKNYDLSVDLFNANILSNNMGSISKEDDWDIERMKNVDILTYSFPCQDLSTAGKMGGLERESGTRSSLMWKVLDVLKKYDEKDLPKVLMMENVSVIKSTRYEKGLNNFKKLLHDLGYVSKGIVINSKDLNGTQARNRYFLISTLRDVKMNEDQIQKEILKVANKEGFPKKLEIRDVVKDINKLSKSARNSIYEEQINDWLTGKELPIKGGIPNNSSKIQKADRAYKTFNQAQILIGLDHPNIPTITFQGEFSRIRVFEIKGKKVKVRQFGSKENWLFMGFSEKDYKKISNYLSDRKISALAGNSITLKHLLAIFDYLKSTGVWNDEQ